MKHLPRPSSIADSLLVTHKHCSDGSGAALMFLSAGGKRENILYAHAGSLGRFVEENHLLEDPRFIIIADVGINSKNKHVADALEKRGNVVILDHHKTSIHLQGRDWCEIDMDTCGTELARRYCELEVPFMKEYAELADDIDRWLLKHLPISMDLATFHSFVGQEEYINRFTRTSLWQRKFLGHGFLLPNENEMVAILNSRREEKIAEAMQNLIIKDINVAGVEVKVGYSTAHTGNPSLLMHRMLDAHPEIQVAATFNIENGIVGLRSRDDYDCSVMAQFFDADGGGHAKAAGHKMPPGIVEDLVSSIHGV